MGAALNRSGSRGRGALVVLGLATLTFALLLLLSRVVGPSFPEVVRFRTAEQLGALLREAGTRGPGTLAAGEGRAALERLGEQSRALALLSSWSMLSVGRVGLLDALTALRLPWLAVCAVGPAALYAIVAPARGRRLALSAAALLAFTPRWLHGALVGSDGVLVASLTLVVVAGALRGGFPAPAGSGRAPARACANVAAALALGVGLALSRGVSWGLAIVVAHHWATRRGALRRLLRRGALPLPAFVFPALVVVPLAVVAVDPLLWTRDLVAVIRALLAPLATTVNATDYAGRLVSAPPLPRGFAAVWLLETMPTSVLVLALIGGGVVFQRALARRFATGSARPARDPWHLDALAMLGLAVAALGPALVPDGIATFPPRVELALPFTALLAAFGLDAAAVRALGAIRAPYFAALVVALLAASALSQPATASASFGWHAGGTARVVARRALSSGDGSELGGVLAALDAHGSGSARVDARDVPRELWDVLRKSRRLRTEVVAGAGPGALVVGRGEAVRGQPIRRVRCGGATLWTLSRE